MKAKRWIPFILLAAFILPFAVRFITHYRGIYQALEISSIDSASLVQPDIEHRVYQDMPEIGEGRVVIDLSKENNLQVDDLTPLRDRLAARGLEVIAYDGVDLPLDEALKSATALVVAAPTLPYGEVDVETVRAFVKDGGRLLLAADPTRPIPVSEEDSLDYFLSLYYATPATPEINSIANPFGITYFADYLYNLTENAGNYRNVTFQPGDAAGALGEGIENVVFFAAHSLSTEGDLLLLGDANTLSNARAGENPLSPAVISPDGQVLALGDITFMAPSYHTIADNDRLLSNLADWLADGQRAWSLEEYPFLFRQPVDIVQTISNTFEPGLIAAISPLKADLEAAGLQASLSQEPMAGHDAIYLSTYGNLESVQAYLDNAQVTISMPDEQETIGEGEDGEASDAETGTIQVEGWGSFSASGMSFFLVDRSAERTTLVVLSKDEAALSLALERLAYNDFSNCESYKALRVCSDESSTEWGAGEEEEPEDSGEAAGSVFILSVDAGEGVFTSAYDMEVVLYEAGYEVTVWSTYEQGLPSSDDLTGYDAYVVDSGDFTWDETIGDAVYLISSQSASFFITGEQPLDFQEQGMIVDLEVLDSAHPILQGFEPGQTISLYDAANPIPAIVLSDLGEAEVLFNRGASSEQAGTAAIAASEDNGYRYVLAAFAMYRLPEEAFTLLVINIIDWLVYRT